MTLATPPVRSAARRVRPTRGPRSKERCTPLSPSLHQSSRPSPRRDRTRRDDADSLAAAGAAATITRARRPSACGRPPAGSLHRQRPITAAALRLNCVARLPTRQKSNSTSQAPSLPSFISPVGQHDRVHGAHAGAADRLNTARFVFQQLIEDAQVKVPCAPPPCSARLVILGACSHADGARDPQLI